MNPWLTSLNPEQQEAVQHVQGPLLILAGAGSGKTTVLVHRTGYLISQGACRPENLFVLTFTNKAARELKHRVAAKIGSPAKKVWAGTFHSLGLQILREFHAERGLPQRFSVLDPSDGVGIIKELLSNVRHPDKSIFAPDRLLQKIGLLRENKNARELTPEDPEWDMVEILAPKYRQRLRALGVVDLDSLILDPVDLFASNERARATVQSRVQYLMVDEFQDTSISQMKFIDALIAATGNLAVVGDDDQAIYGWRGAFVENILKFHHQRPDTRIIRLERNYRSQKGILDLANAVIECNSERHRKILRAENRKHSIQKPELYVLDNENDELEWVLDQVEAHQKSGEPWRSLAILYRSNTQGAPIEAALRSRRIPYRISGSSSFFDRKETRDLVGYLRSAVLPNEISVRRVLNTPPRGLGENAFEVLEALSTSQKRSFVDVVLRSDAPLELQLEAESERQLQAAQAKGLLAFRSSLKALRALLVGSNSLMEDLKNFFKSEVDYLGYLRAINREPEQASKHWQWAELFFQILENNVKASSEDRLGAVLDFLDRVDLRDQDTGDKDDDAIQMMTLHASKGLEWPTVLLLGVEEDILPHRRLGSDISEERRLFYVGITRAQRDLKMARVKERKVHGRIRPQAPSRFLIELPGSLFTEVQGMHKPWGEDERKAQLAALMSKLEQPRRPDITS